MDWREKVTLQNCGRGCVGLIPEMKHNQQCGHLGCSKKQQHWIYSSQPRHLPVPEPAI